MPLKSSTTRIQFEVFKGAIHSLHISFVSLRKTVILFNCVLARFEPRSGEPNTNKNKKSTCGAIRCSGGRKTNRGLSIQNSDFVWRAIQNIDIILYRSEPALLCAHDGKARLCVWQVRTRERSGERGAERTSVVSEANPNASHIELLFLKKFSFFAKNYCNSESFMVECSHG